MDFVSAILIALIVIIMVLFIKFLIELYRDRHQIGMRVSSDESTLE